MNDGHGCVAELFAHLLDDAAVGASEEDGVQIDPVFGQLFLQARLFDVVVLLLLLLRRLRELDAAPRDLCGNDSLYFRLGQVKLA